MTASESRELAKPRGTIEPAHEPHRPSWRCAVCPGGTPWPCSPARVQLAEAYSGDPIARAVPVAGLMPAAAVEAGVRDPAEWYERFVAWTRCPVAAR
ncbi:flavin reductase [Solwaraspora sp. WMMD406]|uniref:flavin reductase n=1 Tax=Solwaraspora sp. WMMD406 TaxID=3016095 RepID=UPI002416CB1D|nr:flavin reductase [Solwaraspora sp. WMMD406]MDG4767880.1 flavin reductase [Solwaraspora sp. WMMD406]